MCIPLLALLLALSLAGAAILLGSDEPIATWFPSPNISTISFPVDSCSSETLSMIFRRAGIKNVKT